METDPGRTFIHEVTNAVTIVMGQCFLLELDQTISPAVRTRLDAIAIATERIAKLIHEYPAHHSEGRDREPIGTKQTLTGSS